MLVCPNDARKTKAHLKHVFMILCVLCYEGGNLRNSFYEVEPKTLTSLHNLGVCNVFPVVCGCTSEVFIDHAFLRPIVYFSSIFNLAFLFIVLNVGTLGMKEQLMIKKIVKTHTQNKRQ